jgi:hypothetical protein
MRAAFSDAATCYSDTPPFWWGNFATRPMWHPRRMQLSLPTPPLDEDVDVEDEAVAVDVAEIVMTAAAPASLALVSRSTHGRGSRPVELVGHNKTLIPLLLRLHFHLQVTCPGRQPPSEEGDEAGLPPPPMGLEA